MRQLRVDGTLVNGTSKEIELMYRYIPNFKGLAQVFVDAGPPGMAFVNLLAEYYRNILTARDQEKMIAATTFCNNPAILIAMDIVPTTFEILTANGCPWSDR